MNKIGYSGDDITGYAEVIRNKETKSAIIDIKEDVSWKIYSGGSAETIDMESPLAESRADGTHPLDVPKEVRSYFQFVTDEGSAIMAERHLPMTGGYNFRDLGGYPTRDGKYVKWGMLIRSDEMNNLTDEDLTYLASIPLVSVVDFRSPEEVNNAPDRIPASVKEVYAYQITPGDLMGAVQNKLPDEREGVKLMEQMNVLLVTQTDAVEQYRKFFSLLQNETNLPLLFHCSAGKDRTGMAAALILLALGVDEETVIEDYLLSTKYVEEKYASYVTRYPALKPLLEVRESYIREGLEAIRNTYGSVENYLAGTLGVDIENFRRIYLY